MLSCNFLSSFLPASSLLRLMLSGNLCSLPSVAQPTCIHDKRSGTESGAELLGLASAIGLIRRANHKCSDTYAAQQQPAEAETADSGRQQGCQRKGALWQAGRGHQKPMPHATHATMLTERQFQPQSQLIYILIVYCTLSGTG